MYDQGTLSFMTRGLPATRHVAWIACRVSSCQVVRHVAGGRGRPRQVTAVCTEAGRGR